MTASSPYRLPVTLLALLAASTLGLILAMWLFDARGALLALDQRIFDALAAWEPPAGAETIRGIVRDVTALGGLTVAGLVSVSAAVYLLALGRHREAVFLLAIVGIGVALAFVAKELVGRPRPPAPPGAPHVSSPSFPSAHASTSAVVYLTLAVIVVPLLQSRLARVYTTLLAILLALTIGASRMYLGVHWFSDVVGGWMLGIGWTLIAWIAHRHLVQRGYIHPVTTDPARPRSPSPHPIDRAGVR